MPIYVPLNSQALRPEDLAQLAENLAAAGEGSQPYIRSEDLAAFAQQVADVSSLSLSGENKFAYAFVQPPAPGALEDDDPCYLRHGASTEANGSSDYSDQDLNEMIADYERRLNELASGIDETDYYNIEDGFHIPDAAKLEELFRTALGLIYAIQILSMVAEANHNQVVKAANILFDANKALSRVASQINQIIDTHAGNFNNFINQVFTTSLEYNQSAYQRAYAAADSHNDSFGERVWDWMSGGENSQDVMNARIRASERFENASRRTLAALKEVLTALGCQTANLAAKLDQLIIQRPNGYLEIDTQMLLDIRNELAAARDLQIAYYEAALAPAETMETLEQILFEAGGGSDKKLVLNIVNQAKQHILAIFDQAANMYLLLKQLHNQRNYDQKQLEKIHSAQGWNIASTIFTFVAIAIAVVVTIIAPPAGVAMWYSLGAIGAGLLAGATRWWGARQANDNIADEFLPLERGSAYEEIRDIPNSGDEALDFLMSLEQEERRLLNRPGRQMLVTMSDGYQSINHRTFFQIVETRENIQLLRDLVLQIQINKIHASLVAAQIMFGVQVNAGAKTIVDAFSESQESGKDLDVEASKYALEDLKNAQNQELAQNIAMSNASRSFGITVGASLIGAGLFTGVAALGGAVSAFAYFPLGYGIGGAVGGAAAQMVNAKRSVGVAYLLERDIIEMLRDQQQRSIEDSFEQMENNYLIQILEDAKAEIIAGKSLKIINLQEKLGQLETLKGLWLDLTLTQAEAAKNFAYQEAGVSGPPDDLNEQLRAHSSKALAQKIEFALTILREAQEVRDRERQAQREYQNAKVNFGISVAVAAVMSAAGGTLVKIGAIGQLTQRIGMTILNLGAPAINISTGINNIIFYRRQVKAAQARRDDLGADFDTAKEQRSQHLASGATGATTRLDRVEIEIISETTQKMLARYGLNAGYFANFQAKYSRLFSLKELIYKLTDLENEKALEAAQEAFGQASALASGQGKKAGQQQRLIAFAALQNLFNGLRTMSQRAREADRNRLMLWQSIVSTTLSSAIAVLSGLRTWRAETARGLADTARGNDSKALEAQDEINTLQEQGMFWQPVQVSLNTLKILNAFSGIITRAIYEEQRGNNQGAAPDEVAAPTSGERGLGASLGRLEAQSVTAQTESGFSALQQEANINQAEINDDLRESGLSGVEATNDIVGNWRQEYKYEHKPLAHRAGIAKAKQEALDAAAAKSLREKISRARREQEKYVTATQQGRVSGVGAVA